MAASTDRGPRHVASWNLAEPGANDARKLVDWMASTAETCGLADPDPALARALS